MVNKNFILGCIRMLLLFTIFLMMCRICEGAGRAGIPSVSINRVRKLSTTGPTVSNNKARRPKTGIGLQITRIAPSSRVPYCPKPYCSAKVPKRCRRIAVVRLRSGKRCRRCSIRRTRQCRIATVTRSKPIPTRSKTTPTKSRRRGSTNNFENRWKKGFSSD